MNKLALPDCAILEPRHAGPVETARRHQAQAVADTTRVRDIFHSDLRSCKTMHDVRSCSSVVLLRSCSDDIAAVATLTHLSTALSSGYMLNENSLAIVLQNKINVHFHM